MSVLMMTGFLYITAQPPPGEDGGPVTVRNMTKEDVVFAGRMTVECFRSKYEHAAGKRRLVPGFVPLHFSFIRSHMNMGTYMFLIGLKPPLPPRR